MQKATKRLYLYSLLWIALTLALITTAVEAQEQSLAYQEIVLKSDREWLKTSITYQCTEKAIDQVMMDLAELANVDIVKSPKVTGTVTAKVTNVPLEEVLTNILEAHDYTYIATENMIRVIAQPEIVLAREKPITRVYQINYADANDVAMALRKFVSANGRVAFSKGTGHIIVTDTESKIKGIDKFIGQIDQITPQVLVEVRIYDITSKEGFELSPDWFVGRNAPLEGDYIPETETTTTEIGPSSNTFTEERIDDISESSFTQGNYRDADDGFGSFMTDTSGTVQRNETSEMLNSGWTEVQTLTREPRRMENLRRKPFVGGHFDRETGGSVRFSVLNDAVAVDFVLSMLHQTVEAKLLANPRVLVLDNQTANFETIRQVPYRELLQVAREDPITYTEFKDVGVRLKVTPHIARDGMIRLHIMPEFGVLVSQDAVSVLTTKDDFGRDVHQNVLGVPTVDTRRADTIAMIKDGQTIVIGGLRKRKTSKDISKVPLLADLPLVGGLFKSETESVEVNELVIFITTRIVTELVLSEIEKRQFEATDLGPARMSDLRLEGAYFSKPADEADVKSELDELLRLLEEED
jgi:type IV pilus assembly protein PilQ